jgi:hypothetical protein
MLGLRLTLARDQRGVQRTEARRGIPGCGVFGTLLAHSPQRGRVCPVFFGGVFGVRAALRTRRSPS